MALCDRLEAQLATRETATSQLLDALLHEALGTASSSPMSGGSEYRASHADGLPARVSGAWAREKLEYLHVRHSRRVMKNSRNVGLAFTSRDEPVDATKIE